MWISVTVELPVPDVVDAQNYYRDVLGFKIGWTADDESFGAMYADSNEIFLRRSAEPRPGTVCCIRVLDVEAVHAARRDAGARIVSELEDKPWSMREFVVEDPYGHRFRIGQSTLMS
jgi:catechol 2,3-dioxygenase-like lactoylglutathione lyase family enzyme